MTIKISTTLLFFFIAILIIDVNAQHLKFKNYSVGYRVFEINAIGNNPITIARFLKDPVTYQNFINSIKYTILNGNPGIQRLHNYYINAELYKNSTSSGFWKRHTILTGLFISKKLIKDNMAIGNQEFVYSSSDTTLYINQFSVFQKQQFLGAIVGLNRRFRISNKFNFSTGLYYQASFAFFHKYQQQLDSTIFTTRTGRKTKTTRLPDLKGKNFYQWQAMIPLGFELDLYRKKWFFRLEADLGIIGSRFRPKSYYNREALGAGLSLIYQPE
jgi:hypothetical protein